MSCHGCASSFGFLSKEHGCPACGFSFCGKCLKFESEGVKGSQRVCRPCSIKAGQNTSDEKATASYDPPDVFLRRLETLEDPSRPPVTVYTQNPHPALQGFNAESTLPSEQEIRGRLQKLRKRLKAAPSVEEMEERLAKLQGVPLKTRAFSVDAVPSSSTQEEQTCGLLKQLGEEAKLDQSSDQAWQDSIEARLARLRGSEKNTTTKPEVETVPEESMEEEATNAESLMKQLTAQIGKDQPDEESELQIVNRILAEVALEEKMRKSSSSSESEDENPISDVPGDELPWCCICNEDATLRCPGCAGDLYCPGCFKQGHDVLDMSEHKAIPFNSQTQTTP